LFGFIREKKMKINLNHGLIFISLLTLSACSSGEFKNPEDWNKKDRGIAIGGASGAVVGGIVGSQSGNAGVGALLGGAAGAAGGGLIGNELDKKKDR